MEAAQERVDTLAARVRDLKENQELKNDVSALLLYRSR